jgi:heavy metal sensor kinase
MWFRIVSNSAKTRLSTWFAGILFLFIVIFSLALYISLGKSLIKKIDSAIEIVARKKQIDIMEEVERYGIGPLDYEEIEDIEELKEEKINFPLIYAQLLQLSEDGTGQNMEIIAKSRNLNRETLPLPHYESKENKSISFENFSNKRLSPSSLRLVTLPFKIAPYKYYIIQFATTRQEVEKTLNTLLMIILAIDPILLLLSFAGGYFMVNKTLRPVKTVVSSAKKITAEDLSHRIPAVDSRDEIGELVDTFNDMIARLDRSFHRMKQFSNDVSHEFKTPLAIMKSEIHVILRKKRKTPEYIKTLTSILEEVNSLQKIIDHLLLLSETDEKSSDIPFSSVSVDKIVLEVFEDIQGIAVKKNLRFVLKKIQEVELQGVETLLRMAFYNLFENAVKYTGDGGEVEILLENKPGFAQFSIKDSGIGIPADELPFIFDRFYRVDKSRSKRMGSAGLGLSIVDRIIRLHNGKIKAASTPGKGSTFVIVFPG